jgi:sugar O-acyltransferase (sialic acid O-acetyltransferase NeuD family)
MGPLAIFGAGGHARECAWVAEACGYAPVIHIVDDAYGALGPQVGQSIMTLSHFLGDGERFPVIIAVGDGGSRRSIAGRLAAAGCRFATLLSPSAMIAPSAIILPGAAVFHGAYVSTNVRLGAHTHVNALASVSHDCNIGPYVSISPRAVLCGYVHAGAGAMIGASATILNGTPERPMSIGEDAIIGGGALVTSDIPPFATAVGVPARIIKLRMAQS